MKRIHTKRTPHWCWEYRKGHEDAMAVALRVCGIKVRLVAGMAELTTDAGSLVVLPGQFIIIDLASQLQEVVTHAEFHRKYEE